MRTWKSAPPLAKGSRVFAKTPGRFSTSLRHNVTFLTVTGIAPTTLAETFRSGPRFGRPAGLPRRRNFLSRRLLLPRHSQTGFENLLQNLLLRRRDHPSEVFRALR